MHSLRKCKHILRAVFKKYRRTKEKSPEIYDGMISLQEAILSKDKPLAQEKAKSLEKLYDEKLRPNPVMRYLQPIIGFAIILFAAIIIRQMWFELYEIPTGSMRPTLQEKDRLVVTKSPFGINAPFVPQHFYFDPHLVKRGSIIVFTSAKMDMKDSNMMYFYLFPGKKQLVKRCMGKPGDTLYFYGGQIFGVDQEGNDITPELQQNLKNNIDYIPFLQFEGKTKLPAQPRQGVYSPLTLLQMNTPVAKMNAFPGGSTQGQMLPNPNKPSYVNAQVDHYYDLWGFKNYGMARLLQPAQAVKFYPDQKIEAASLYLEITHHPSIKNGHLVRNYKNQLMPAIHLSKTLLALGSSDLKTLYQSLTTARFIVKNGTARRYGTPNHQHPAYPKLPGVPDGTYQFQQGTPFKVHTGGVLSKLSPTHPLNQYNQERLLTLYNLGIEFSEYFSPQASDQFLPSRFVYFRNGDLYSMNLPILKADNPSLVRFLHNEYIRQQGSNYVPFDDAGPPLNDKGNIDRSFLERYGCTIPQDHYLALGDNYPMSADSRDFGFVPAGNLRGSPLFIFWPPGNRFGPPLHAFPNFLSFPNLFVWIIALIGVGIGWHFHRKHNHLPLDFGDRP